MATLRQYSSDAVELTWNQLDFKEGFATGTFVTLNFNVDAFTHKSTASGDGVSVFVKDRSGTCVVTVSQESTLHQQLLAVHNQDRSTRDQVFLGKFNDTSSGEVYDLNKMRIVRSPDVSRGTESASFDWTFNVLEIVPVPNVLNATNLVG